MTSSSLTFEQVLLRLGDRRPRDPLQLLDRPVARDLRLLLELLDVRLAVVQPLLAPRDLCVLPLELLLALRQLFLGLGGRATVIRRSPWSTPREALTRFLARLDLPLASDRLRLAPGHLHAQAAPDDEQRGCDCCSDSESTERGDEVSTAVPASWGEGFD